MKKIILFLTLLSLSLATQSQNTGKQKFIGEITKNTTSIFEGSVLSTEKSFYSTTGNIFTLIKVKVSKINFGNVETSEILIAKSGGTIGNREEISSHGNNMISDYNTFFLNNEFMIIDASTNKSYYKLSNIAYDEGFNIINGESVPFKNYNDFYSELSSKINVTFEKKSPVEKYVKQKIKAESEISYETKLKNFNDLIELKNNLKNGVQLKTSLVNDLTLQITNPTLTGSLYEFDINIRADNNSTYLDNVPVWITYNTSVFNSSVVAINNVTVTNGSNFNNSNYYPANNFIQDNSPNTMIFLVSAIVTNPVRTGITTSYQQLAHVQMNIKNCGNVNVNLTNAIGAVNGCWYTSTPTSTVFQTYNTLTYNGSLSTNINCVPTILNFNTSLRGGVDTLKIRGFSFGSTKGTGEVRFRNADLSGHPYITQLDAQDYISWSDTLIRVLVPSFNQNLNTSNGKNNSAGTGSFIVTTSLSQTVASSVNNANSPFSVPFSLLSVLNPNTNNKSKVHLVGSGINNNYIVYCDSTIGKNPYKFGLIKKVMHEWGCNTSANFELVYDSTVVNTPFINYIYFTNLPINDPTLGNTILGIDKCPNGKNVIGNFDIVLKLNETWLFDSTATQTLNPNTYDFYEIISHELGHALGIQHAIDVNSLLYWTPMFSPSVPILPVNRKKLVPNSDVTDGGLYQVLSSIAAIGPSDLALCSFKKYDSYNHNCTGAIGIKEISGNQLKAKVFPNPSSDGKFSLAYYNEKSKTSSIQICDLLGNIIYAKINNENDNEITESIDLNNFSSGIYILTLRSDIYKSTFKIVKQ